MRTNIEIDDALISKAMKLNKAKTKKDVVHIALNELIKSKEREKMLHLKGKVVFFEGPQDE